MDKVNKFLLLLSVFFALLSSLRIPFLPEVQFLIFSSGMVFFSKPVFRVLAFAVIVLTTHHYVVPDAVFRFESGSYPSIYTSTALGFRVLDAFVVALFLYSLRYADELRRLFSFHVPMVLLPLSLIGMILLGSEQFAKDQFFFLARSFTLFIAIYLLASKLPLSDFLFTCFLAIVGWTAKMFFAVLFPHENPWIREIFGFVGNIYFAGDEYLSLGVYLSILVFFVCHRSFRLSYYRWAIFLCFISCLLSLYSLRSGSVPYFIILFFVVFFSRLRLHGSLHLPVNLLILIYPFVIFCFLLLNAHYALVLSGSFEEYSALSLSAVDSILNLSILEGVLGVSAFGKYELIGLPSIFDHSYSFGNDAGELYRYELWTIPGGRLILNVGMLGYLAYYIIMVCYSFASRVTFFYIVIAVSPIFYLGNVTLVYALAGGFAASFLVKHSRVTS